MPRELLGIAADMDAWVERPHVDQEAPLGEGARSVGGRRRRLLWHGIVRPPACTGQSSVWVQVC